MDEPEENSLADLLVTAVSDLRVGDAGQRADAARKLGRSRSRIAASYLIEALSDKEPEVRREAVEALAEIRDPAAIEPLQALLDRETDPLISKTFVLDAIEKIKTSGTTRTAPQASLKLVASQNSEPHKLENVVSEAATGLRAEAERRRLEDVYRRVA